MREIAREPAVANALFEILETQKLLESNARLTLLSGPHSRVLADILAAVGKREVANLPPWAAT